MVAELVRLMPGRHSDDITSKDNEDRKSAPDQRQDITQRTSEWHDQMTGEQES